MSPQPLRLLESRRWKRLSALRLLQVLSVLPQGGNHHRLQMDLVLMRARHVHHLHSLLLKLLRQIHRVFLVSPLWLGNPSLTSRKADLNMARYEDGEVLRYGAGESYRPFNNNRDRSPRRPRSPPRDRDRDRDKRPRTPPVASDSYVPGRSPRRRSRTPDRYRVPDRARDNGGESWRRRDTSRGRVRSPVRRPSPPSRRSPRRSPLRYSPAPRRDDRFDRARSPRRDFDNRDIR